MAADFLARGLAAKTFATVRASSIAVEEFGARTTGDARAAVQRAIDLAVANGIPKVTSRLARMDIWEPVLDDPGGSGAAWFARNRTLRIPACDALDIDFGGAQITLKGPTGGPTLPGQVSSGAAYFGGFWSGGFLSATGVIKRLRIANVTCDGGYTGNPMIGAGINLLHKGLLCQDIGDINLGAGATSAPVADELSKLGIPFIFATGYTGSALRGIDSGRLMVSKPYNEPELIAGLIAAVEAAKSCRS